MSWLTKIKNVILGQKAQDVKELVELHAEETKKQVKKTTKKAKKTAKKVKKKIKEQENNT